MSITQYTHELHTKDKHIQTDNKTTSRNRQPTTRQIRRKRINEKEMRKPTKKLAGKIEMRLRGRMENLTNFCSEIKKRNRLETK